MSTDQNRPSAALTSGQILYLQNLQIRRFFLLAALAKAKSEYLDLLALTYFYGARYYDPRVSTWVSADPALGKYLGRKSDQGNSVFMPMTLALYGYANLNPIRMIDPDGMEVKVQAQFAKNFALLRQYSKEFNATVSHFDGPPGNDLTVENQHFGYNSVLQNLFGKDYKPGQISTNKKLNDVKVQVDAAAIKANEQDENIQSTELGTLAHEVGHVAGIVDLKTLQKAGVGDASKAYQKIRSTPQGQKADEVGAGKFGTRVLKEAAGNYAKENPGKVNPFQQALDGNKQITVKE